MFNVPFTTRLSELRSVFNMRCRIFAYFVLFGLSSSITTFVFAADTLGPTEILRRIAPSIVHITGYMGQQGQEPYAEASGIFIEDGGFLVSVSNVFTNPKTRRLCERYLVRLFDGRQLHAKMFSVDAILNLIVLKVVEPGVYPAIETDFTARVRPGDRVLALAGGTTQPSFPYTAGYVKARHKKSIYGAGLTDMFINSHIQLPAHAYGGPLLNEEGEVIGINTPNLHRQDPEAATPEEEHALPLRVVKGFIKISKVFPTSEQNWIGLAFRPLNHEEKTQTSKILGNSHGLLVEYVWDEGPAGQLDIQPGDILFSLNGKGLWNLHQLNRLLWHMETGISLDLAFLREGKGVFRKVRLEKRPAWAGYMSWQGRRNAAGQTPAAEASDS